MYLVTLLLRILHGIFQLILNSLDYFEGDYGLGDRGPTRPLTYLSSFWRWRHPDSRNTRRYTAQFHAKLFWGRNFCSSRSCHLKLNRLLSYTDILVAQVRIIFIRCPWIVVIIPVGWSFLHNIGCEVTACLLSFFKDIRQRSYLVGTNAEIINYCLMLPRHSKGLVWATMLLGSILSTWMIVAWWWWWWWWWLSLLTGKLSRSGGWDDEWEAWWWLKDSNDTDVVV